MPIKTLLTIAPKRLWLIAGTTWLIAMLVNGFVGAALYHLVF